MDFPVGFLNCSTNTLISHRFSVVCQQQQTFFIGFLMFSTNMANHMGVSFFSFEGRRGSVKLNLGEGAGVGREI